MRKNTPISTTPTILYHFCLCRTIQSSTTNQHCSPLCSGPPPGLGVKYNTLPRWFLLTHPIYLKYCLGGPSVSASVPFLHLIPHNHCCESTSTINLLTLAASGIENNSSCSFNFFFTQIPPYCSFCHNPPHQNKAIKDHPIVFTILLAPSTFLPILLKSKMRKLWIPREQ